MNIIVCVDDQNGLSLFGRRQSMDSVLRREAQCLAEGELLWMNEYSAKLFSQDGTQVHADDNFLENAPENAWCFVENRDITPFAHKIRKLAVYRWNRLYPSDAKFPEHLFADKWEKISQREFSGSSHERITEEVYKIWMISNC